MLSALTRWILTACFGLAVLLPGAAAFAAPTQLAPGFPITITDDSGVSTTFDAPPRRIVSLDPGLTETTFALGAGLRLVAVDRFSIYPPEAAAIEPRLTTYPSPSIETIVDLKPDLVLSLADRDDVITRLRSQNVKVLKLLPRNFDAAVGSILELGRLYGQADAGQAIATDMVGRRDAVVAAVAGAPRPRVYEELDGSDPGKPFAAGPNGFYGQIIDLAGGSNIFGDLPGDFGQVSAETVLERDPEVIILTDGELPLNPQTPEMVSARPGWDTVTAVRNAAVYPVTADTYSTYGPRLVDALEDLAAKLHPDLFPPPSPASHPAFDFAAALVSTR
jgi:iron complex transport system substrate-binding protein